MRRLGLVLVAGLGMAACNDGDVTAPPPPDDMEAPAATCDAEQFTQASPDMARTCEWSLPGDRPISEVVSSECASSSGDGDCPGLFVCRSNDGGQTAAWEVANMQLTCSNPVAAQVPPPAGPANLFVALNGDTNAGDVVRFSRAAPVGGSTPAFVMDDGYLHNSRENQGSGIDAAGHLVHVGDGLGQGVDGTGQPDGSNAPGLVTACEMNLVDDVDGEDVPRRGTAPAAARPFDNDYGDNTDRELRGQFNGMTFPPEFEDNPGLNAPKGLTIAPTVGLAFVADFGSSTVRAYGLSADGNQGPVGSFNTPVAPWDTAYDALNDTLYVAFTNGRVGVYQNVTASLFSGATPGFSALLRIVDQSNADISVNLHGAVYEPVSDSLILSDVGDPQVATDGQIFVLSGISERTSDTLMPSRIIAGSNTQLGNPVDIVLHGRDLVVAEKSNDLLLTFNDIFASDDVNVVPSSMTMVTKPESLALQPLFGASRPGVTDISDSTDTFAGLLTSINAGDSIRIERRTLANGFPVQAAYEIDEDGSAGQNVMLGLNGEAIVTVTLANTPPVDPASGDLLFVNAFATRSNNLTFTASQDRRLSPAIEGPRGLDIAPDLGLIFIADFGAGDIKVVAQCGNGSVLYTLEVADVDTDDNDQDAPPWDVDYDPVRGDLYAAMTNGSIAVYRGIRDTLSDAAVGASIDYNFTVNLETLDGTTPVEASTNLHGIEHVPGQDVLILSDVGDPGSDTDGKIFLLRAAGSLATTEQVDVEISGASTLLGNPVDIAFDGRNLFVAEKANGGGRILRFDDILSVQAVNGGPNDLTPDANVPAASVESLVMIPDYVASP